MLQLNSGNKLCVPLQPTGALTKRKLKKIHTVTDLKPTGTNPEHTTSVSSSSDDAEEAKWVIAVLFVCMKNSRAQLKTADTSLIILRLYI